MQMYLDDQCGLFTHFINVYFTDTERIIGNLLDRLLGVIY